MNAAGGTSALPSPGPSRLITRLHTDLLLPSPLGPVLVGLGGVLGPLLIVSGILIHRHIIRDLFVVRLFRSQRLALHDMHALIETWALPFHFLLSLSGAVLGFILLASFLVQRVAYGGDGERALEDFEPALVASGIEAETADLDAVLAPSASSSGRSSPSLCTWSIGVIGPRGSRSWASPTIGSSGAAGPRSRA